MSAPEWLHELFGWRAATEKGRPRCRRVLGLEVAPNIADIGGAESLRIAGAVYEALGIPTTRLAGALQDDEDGRTASTGASLETKIASDLGTLLPQLDSRGTSAGGSGRSREPATSSNMSSSTT